MSFKSNLEKVTPCNMFAKSNFAKFYKGVQRSLESYPNLLDHLNSELKMSIISSTDIIELLSGDISNIVILHSMKSALQKTARYAAEFALSQPKSAYDVSTILWNPIVEGALDALADCQPSKPKLLPRSKPGHTSGSQAKKVTTSPSKNPKSVATRPETPKFEGPKDVPKVYRELSNHLGASGVVFRQAHIPCKVPKCEPCRSLARSVALTPCEGHLPCLKSGWFPHVGKGLWRFYQQKHQAGELFTFREKDIPGTILPLCQYMRRNMTAEAQSSASSMVTDDDSQSTYAPSEAGSIQTVSEWHLDYDDACQNPSSPKRTASEITQ